MKKASVSVQEVGPMEAEAGPSAQVFPSPPVADVVRGSADAVGPSSLPIEDLADSLVPLQMMYSSGRLRRVCPPPLLPCFSTLLVFLLLCVLSLVLPGSS